MFPRRTFLRALGRASFLTSTASFSRAEPHGDLVDVVVLLPGIMGSVLKQGEREVWGLSSGAVFNLLRTLGASFRGLKLDGDDPEVDDLGDGISASKIFPDTHLIPGFWKIDGYSKISETIKATFKATDGLNYFEFPYDWRRDCRVAARRLARESHGWLKRWREISGKRDAKLILIAHSMGGLVSRYFLECLEGWKDTRLLISFGTPYRGSLNAVDTLSNGLLKGMLGFTETIRSFTSLYQLLPVYPCLDTGGADLKRLAEAQVPNIDPRKATAALNEFHWKIRDSVLENIKIEEYRRTRYRLHAIAGTFQKTSQMARLRADKVELLDRFPDDNPMGDGTVSEVSATPIEPDELTAQHNETYIAEMHGSLQNSSGGLDQLKGVLSTYNRNRRRYRNVPVASRRVRLEVEDLFNVGEEISLNAVCENARADLKAQVVNVSSGLAVGTFALRLTSGTTRIAKIGQLPEGVYRVTVSGALADTVTELITVMPG